MSEFSDIPNIIGFDFLSELEDNEKHYSRTSDKGKSINLVFKLEF
jgi:hypothetical protein